MQNRVVQLLALCLIAGSALLDNFSCFQSATRQQNPALPSKESKPEKTRIASHLVLISVSGLRADFANSPGDFHLTIPNIEALRAKGAYAYAVESVYPSQRNPAHVTIATGVLPSDHGIYSDYSFDEQTGMPSAVEHWRAEEIKADTIWAAAKREELVTAAVGYPLTGNAVINFNLPTAPKEQTGIESSPFFYKSELLNEVLTELKSKPDLATLFSKQARTEADFDRLKAEAAVYLIEKCRPNLLLINFESFDQAQSHYGLLSTEALTALTFVDGLIGKITSEIENANLSEQTTFIIVSDHGSSKVELEFRPNVLLEKNKLLTADKQGNIKSWKAVAQSLEGSAAIYLKDPKDEIIANEVEKIFGELESHSDNPLWRISNRRDISMLGADPRAAFYLDAAPPYKISGLAKGSRITKTESRSAHGYLPSRAEMRAALIISGRGIKANQRIEYARLVDIAPTVAYLLGLEMKTVRGRVLSEVIIR